MPVVLRSYGDEVQLGESIKFSVEAHDEDIVIHPREPVGIYRKTIRGSWKLIQELRIVQRTMKVLERDSIHWWWKADSSKVGFGGPRMGLGTHKLQLTAKTETKQQYEKHILEFEVVRNNDLLESLKARVNLL